MVIFTRLARILRTFYEYILNIYCRVFNGQVSQITLVGTPPSYLFKMRFIFVVLTTPGDCKSYIPFTFPAWIAISISHLSTWSTFSVHLILLVLFCLIIFCEVYMYCLRSVLWISSFFCFLIPLVSYFCLLIWNILSSTLFTNDPSLCSLNAINQVWNPRFFVCFTLSFLLTSGVLAEGATQRLFCKPLKHKERQRQERLCVIGTGSIPEGAKSVNCIVWAI